MYFVFKFNKKKVFYLLNIINSMKSIVIVFWVYSKWLKLDFVFGRIKKVIK